MSIAAVAPLPQFQFVRAGRALAALLKDPDDLPQVFTIIESMSGTALHRLVLGFRLREGGRRLLREQPDVGAILVDRARLRAMPEGSLGRAYLAFVEQEGISAEGIRTASVQGRATNANLGSHFAFVKDRMRDTHDLWHTVTGYSGDVIGELSLLAFTLAQNWNFGVAAIVVAALFRGYASSTDTNVVIDGFRRGWTAKGWLPAVEWETLLERPLAEVRAELGIEPVPEYAPVRSSDLRAQGVI